MAKTLIKFYADWCVPCKRMQPIIDELEKEMPDVKFDAIDVEVGDDRANFNISSVPTFVLLEDGNEIGRKSGMMTKKELTDFIAEG